MNALLAIRRRREPLIEIGIRCVIFLKHEVGGLGHLQSSILISLWGLYCFLFPWLKFIVFIRLDPGPGSTAMHAPLDAVFVQGLIRIAGPKAHICVLHDEKFVEGAFGGINDCGFLVLYLSLNNRSFYEIVAFLGQFFTKNYILHTSDDIAFIQDDLVGHFQMPKPLLPCVKLRLAKFTLESVLFG